jgi:hypothetical protein
MSCCLRCARGASTITLNLSGVGSGIATSFCECRRRGEHGDCQHEHNEGKEAKAGTAGRRNRCGIIHGTHRALFLSGA